MTQLDDRDRVRVSRGNIFAGGAAALAAVFIIANLPIAAVAHAVTDDALTVRLARHLLAGEWLGSYDSGTLMAGVPYAVLVAKAAFFGLPLKLLESVLHLVAAGAIAAVLLRLGIKAWFVVLIFALLALNPVPWSPMLMRVTGEAFAGSLALVVLAGVGFVCLADDVSARWRRVALAAGGFAFALFWLQDPLSAWLYPALIVPVLPHLPAFVRAVRARPVDVGAWRAGGVTFGLDAAAAVGAFALVTLSVASLNAASYGAFITGEARGGGFADAVGAIMRITPVNVSQRFEFSSDVAGHVTRVSAGVRELMPHLNGKIGQTWRANGCRMMALNPCPAGFGGGTMVWALRDAARAAGHMKDPVAADAFFAAIARDIDAACDTGDVPCGTSRSSLISPLRGAEWQALAGSIANALAVTTRLGGGQAGAAPSEGSAADIDAFAKIAGAVTARADTAVSLAGWVASRSCLPQPLIEEADGTVVGAEVFPADDIDAYFKQRKQYPKTQRFTLRAPCKDGACTFRLEGCADGPAVPVRSLSAGTQNANGAMLVFDTVTGTADATEPAPDDSWAASVGGAIAAIYSALGPVVAPFGLVLFALAGIAARDYPDLRKPWVLAAACLAAVLGRAAYVGFVDVTTMPAADIRHMAPAAPFFLLFLGLSAALAFTALMRRLAAVAEEQAKRD